MLRIIGCVWSGCWFVQGNRVSIFLRRFLRRSGAEKLDVCCPG